MTASRLGQKADATRFELVNRADEFHDAFGHSRPPFRCFEQLAHRPPHIGLDRGRELRLRCGVRADLIEARQNGLEQYRKPRTGGTFPRFADNAALTAPQSS